MANSRYSDTSTSPWHCSWGLQWHKSLRPISSGNWCNRVARACASNFFKDSCLESFPTGYGLHHTERARPTFTPPLPMYTSPSRMGSLVSLARLGGGPPPLPQRVVVRGTLPRSPSAGELCSGSSESSHHWLRLPFPLPLLPLPPPLPLRVHWLAPRPGSTHRRHWWARSLGQAEVLQ